ncbi:MAG: hypothetical protein AAFY31_11375, partial [Pseudomonadota bacterium]
MNDREARLHRLRSLIFESLARPETFGALIEQTDTAMLNLPGNDVGAFATDFEDASGNLMRTSSYGKTSSVIEFAFDRKARLT